MTLLDVTDLSVASTAGRRAVQSVRPLTFTLSPGETLGLLGQPGSGSSVIAQAIAGVATGAAVTGSVVFDGRDLLTMSERDVAKLREVDIALLSPAVGASAPAAARKGRTRSLPQQPKLLIVDVGADAVDHETSRFIMRLQAEAQTAVVLVTEDLGSLADLTDLVIEMYAGKAVEFADGRTLTYRAHHPYTLSLVTSQPASASPLDAATSGCPYHPRCPYVMDRCVVEEPPPLLVQPAGRHRSACWLPLDLLGVGADVDRRREDAAQAGRNAPAVVGDVTPAAQPSSSQPSSQPSPQPAEALVASTTAVRPRKAGRPAPPARPRSRTVPNEARQTDAPAPAKTAPAKRAASKKAPVKKAAATKAPAKRAAVKTAAATKAPAKSARTAKAPGKKAGPPPAE